MLFFLLHGGPYFFGRVSFPKISKIVREKYYLFSTILFGRDK